MDINIEYANLRKQFKLLQINYSNLNKKYIELNSNYSKLSKELSDRESKWARWCRDQVKKICDEIREEFIQYAFQISDYGCDTIEIGSEYCMKFLDEIQTKYNK